MDINNLTIKEKAQLVERLTNEIIHETQTVEFEFASDKNRRISGSMRTFKSFYQAHARSLNKFVSDCDEEVSN